MDYEKLSKEELIKELKMQKFLRDFFEDGYWTFKKRSKKLEEKLIKIREYIGEVEKNEL